MSAVRLFDEETICLPLDLELLDAMIKMIERANKCEDEI